MGVGSNRRPWGYESFRRSPVNLTLRIKPIKQYVAVGQDAFKSFINPKCRSEFRQNLGKLVLKHASGNQLTLRIRCSSGFLMDSTSALYMSLGGVLPSRRLSASNNLGCTALVSLGHSNLGRCAKLCYFWVPGRCSMI